MCTNCKNKTGEAVSSIDVSNQLKDGYTFNINLPGASENPLITPPDPALVERQRKQRMYIAIGALVVITVVIFYMALKKR
jgi:hypothetical protein